MTKYFYDTEFIEDGKTIDLISIGIVCEDGRELYLQSCEFNIDKASQWVRDNVLMHLEICPYLTQPPGPTYSLGTIYGAQAQHKQGQCLDQLYGLRHRCPWRTREQLKRDILSFTGQNAYMGKNEIELWGYYSAYDHVAFCQLFGTMMDLPKGFPMYTRDIKQWADTLNIISNPQLPEQEQGEHHALDDARHCRVMYEYLASFEKYVH